MYIGLLIRTSHRLFYIQTNKQTNNNDNAQQQQRFGNVEQFCTVKIQLFFFLVLRASRACFSYFSLAFVPVLSVFRYFFLFVL